MVRPRPAVHRTILLVDVEGFGDRRRTNPHQVVVRDGMYRAVRQALGEANIAWANCYNEDRGDGVLILVPPEIPKSHLVESLPAELVGTLSKHNRAHCTEERIRLRMALHAGEITYDDHGVTGASINLAFRLLDASEFKAALAASPGVLAVIASSWFFDEVVRHSTANNPVAYRPIRVAVKETATVGWIHLPDQPNPPDALPAQPVIEPPLGDGGHKTNTQHVNPSSLRIVYGSPSVDPTLYEFLRGSFLEIIPRTQHIFECRDARTARGVPHKHTRRKHTVQVATYVGEDDEPAVPIGHDDFHAWLDAVEQQPVVLLYGQQQRSGKLTLRMSCLHDWLIRDAAGQPDWRNVSSLPVTAFRSVGRHGAMFHRTVIQEVDRVTGSDNGMWRTLRDPGLLPVDEMTLLEFMEFARYLEVPQPVFKRLVALGGPAELVVDCIRKNRLLGDPVIDSWLASVRELSRYEPAGFERRQFRHFTRFLEHRGQGVRLPRYSSDEAGYWRVFTAMYPDVLDGIAHVIRTSTSSNDIVFAASLLSTLTLANDRVASLRAETVLRELPSRRQDFPHYYVRREILRSLAEGGEKAWLREAIDLVATEGATGEEQRYLNSYGWTVELVESKIERRLNSPTLRDQQMRQHLEAMGDVFVRTRKQRAIKGRAY